MGPILCALESHCCFSSRWEEEQHLTFPSAHSCWVWWTLASEVWVLLILKIFISEAFALESFIHIVFLWCSHGPNILFALGYPGDTMQALLACREGKFRASWPSQHPLGTLNVLFWTAPNLESYLSEHPEPLNTYPMYSSLSTPQCPVFQRFGDKPGTYPAFSQNQLSSEDPGMTAWPHVPSQPSIWQKDFAGLPWTVSKARLPEVLSCDGNILT